MMRMEKSTINLSGTKPKKLRVFEAFSGIGAQNAALRNLGINYEIVGTSDWFINAILAYDAIHSHDEPLEDSPCLDEQIEHLRKFTFSAESQHPIKDVKQLSVETVQRLYRAVRRTRNFGSIADVDPREMPEMDMLIYSFPCQDLSTGGNGNGIGRKSGTRSCLIWHIGRILRGLKKLGRLPEYLLMENVPALISDRYDHDFTLWKQELNRYGYNNERPFILDASKFGVPQDRRRLFMVSHLGGKVKVFDKIRQHDWNGNISDFLKMDYSDPTLKEEADEASLNLTAHRRIMWDLNKREMPFSKDTIVHTITCNMDRTQTAALFEYGEKIRRLTMREAFLLMGFREGDYERIKPLGFSYRQTNKLIGNAIVVPVLEEIFRAMFSGTDYMPEA